MRPVRALCLVVVAVCAFGTSVPADVVTISDVPSYKWYHGCGPTAAGMIIGYWDAHGYDNLIPGSNSWSTNQQAVKNMIASPGHIRDYVPTPDRTPTGADPYHADNCVADFNHCSRDPNAYGWSTFHWQDDGLEDYAAYRGYTGLNATNWTFWDNTFWPWYKAEIDAERPVELLVDSDNDGLSDHFVTAIGYDNTPGALEYACYNTWDHNVHWYGFKMALKDVSFGIYGGTSFVPIPEPATMMLVAGGVLVLVARSRRRRSASDV